MNSLLLMNVILFGLWGPLPADECWRNEKMLEASSPDISSASQSIDKSDFERRLALLRAKIRDLRGRVPSDEIPATQCADGQIMNASSDFFALEYLLEDLESFLPSRRSGLISRRFDAGLKEAEMLASAMSENRNPFQGRTGLFQKAYRSKYDATLQPYVLYVPPSYTGQKIALIVALHGMGGDQWQIPRAMRLDSESTEVDALVLSPLARGGMGYWGPAEEEVWEAIRRVRNAYNVDEDRIYLTGYSMGGFGGFHLGLTRPDFWAGVAPICGGYDPSLAENAVNTPFFVFHGGKDDVVPVQRSRLMVDAMRSFNCPLEYAESTEKGHNVWTEIYRDLTPLKCFQDKPSVSKPDRVVYNTRSLRWRNAHWIQIDDFEKYGEIGRVEAKITEPNRIDLDAKNISGVTIFPQKCPLDLLSPFHVYWNGQRVFFGLSADPIGLRPNPRKSENGLRKQHGLSGPCWDVFYEPFLYVYGTGAKDPAENAIIRQEAEGCANWGESVTSRFPIKADTEVNPVDIAGYNLILFGNFESNSVTSRIMPFLPIQFRQDGFTVAGTNYDSPDVVLQIVYPNPLNPERYVMLIAGVDARAICGYYKTRLFRSDVDLLVFDREFLDSAKQGAAQAKKEPLLALHFDGDWKIPSPVGE